MSRPAPSASWYRAAFGDLYPLLYPHRDDASAAAEVADLLAHLVPLSPGAGVLDVGCGTGRHAVAFARAGFGVQALDLSPALLERAAARPALAGRIVRADMRRLPFRQAFDLVVSLFTSFGYFAEEAENAGAIREMARVLRPGGSLVLDHANRLALEARMIPEDARRLDGLRCDQRRRIVGGRMRKDISLRWDDGRRLDWAEDVRLYTAREMRALLRDAGLETTGLYAAFDGTPWSPAAPRMIVVGRKP